MKSDSAQFEMDAGMIGTHARGLLEKGVGLVVFARLPNQCSEREQCRKIMGVVLYSFPPFPNGAVMSAFFVEHGAKIEPAVCIARIARERLLQCCSRRLVILVPELRDAKYHTD